MEDGELEMSTDHGMMFFISEMNAALRLSLLVKLPLVFISVLLLLKIYKTRSEVHLPISFSIDNFYGIRFVFFLFDRLVQYSRLCLGFNCQNDFNYQSNIFAKYSASQTSFLSQSVLLLIFLIYYIQLNNKGCQ